MCVCSEWSVVRSFISIASSPLLGIVGEEEGEEKEEKEKKGHFILSGAFSNLKGTLILFDF